MSLISKIQNLISNITYELKNDSFVHSFIELCDAKRNNAPVLSLYNLKFYKNFCNNFLSDSMVVIDVGANDGWFAQTILRFKPMISVVSYEPLKSQEKYLSIIRKKHKNYKYQLAAIGEKTGKSVIREMAFSGLSSLRDLNKYDYKEGFNTNVVAKYNVNVTTLDKEFKNTKKKLVVKVDTQGYEMEVLRGARDLFKQQKIAAVIIELSTIEKYKNQKTYEQIMTYLHKFGFTIFDLSPFYYERNGRLSEFDAIFIHSSLI